MEIPLTSYYVNLRTVLADPGTEGVYAYADEQLGRALQTTVQCGCGPRLLALAVEDPWTMVQAGEVENYDARGLLVFQAALLMLGGNILFSHKQRALAVNFRPEERAMTLDHLRRQIKRLETGGDPHGTGAAACFAVWQDYENALFPRWAAERVI